MVGCPQQQHGCSQPFKALGEGSQAVFLPYFYIPPGTRGAEGQAEGWKQPGHCHISDCSQHQGQDGS